MAYINNGERVRKAEYALEELLDRRRDKGLFDAIKEYVDAKIEYKIDDLRNEIKRTGDWSPDY